MLCRCSLRMPSAVHDSTDSSQFSRPTCKVHSSKFAVTRHFVTPRREPQPECRTWTHVSFFSHSLFCRNRNPDHRTRLHGDRARIQPAADAESRSPVSSQLSPGHSSHRTCSDGIVRVLSPKKTFLRKAMPFHRTTAPDDPLRFGARVMRPWLDTRNHESSRQFDGDELCLQHNSNDQAFF